MPVYKTSLRMAHDSTWPSRRKWSTTFYYNVANAATAAAALAVGYGTWLRGTLATSVFAYETYATSLTEGDDDYSTVSIAPGDQRGTLNPDSLRLGEKYDVDACLVVTLPAARGRPSRKFWRVGLTEGAVINGVTVAPDIIAAVSTGFAGFVAEVGESLVDPDGQVITGVGRIRFGHREMGRLSGWEVPAPPVG